MCLQCSKPRVSVGSGQDRKPGEPVTSELAINDEIAGRRSAHLGHGLWQCVRKSGQEPWPRKCLSLTSTLNANAILQSMDVSAAAPCLCPWLLKCSLRCACRGCRPAGRS